MEGIVVSYKGNYYERGKESAALYEKRELLYLGGGLHVPYDGSGCGDIAVFRGKRTDGITACNGSIIV